MRVVAGDLRGKAIKGPIESSTNIRPTSDRAKEALFSFLKPYPRGSFLDLCSGTGSIALEAYSRGYKRVVAIDRDAEALELLRINCGSYPIEVIRHDVLAIKDLNLGCYDVVFCDPPYECIEQLWTTLRFEMVDLLEEAGLLILESDESFKPEPISGLKLFKSKKYSRNHFHIFTRNS
jgi:16S rRNA (guanine966-N2)-methyltransferase